MEEVIEELLALAEQGTAVKDPVPVPVGALLGTVRDDTDLDVVTAVPDDVAIVAEEPGLVSLVSTLVGNAEDHGGRDVTVAVDLEGDTRSMADDGVGIPADERAELFEPGTSGAENGPGFGLAIVDAIAAAHDWAVSVTERRWGGARFAVSALDVQQVE
jgi:signal transduction histidine kinase